MLTHLLTNKHDAGATSVDWSRSTEDICTWSRGSFVPPASSAARRSAAVNGVRPAPRCPPEGPTVGSLFSSPDRLPERKHPAVSRISSFLFISVGAVGGAPPQVKLRESWLFKSWANSQTPLAGTYHRGLWFRAPHQSLRGALRSFQPADKPPRLLTRLIHRVGFTGWVSENVSSALLGLKVGFPQNPRKVSTWQHCE